MYIICYYIKELKNVCKLKNTTIVLAFFISFFSLKTNAQTTVLSWSPTALGRASTFPGIGEWEFGPVALRNDIWLKRIKPSATYYGLGYDLASKVIQAELGYTFRVKSEDEDKSGGANFSWYVSQMVGCNLKHDEQYFEIHFGNRFDEWWGKKNFIGEMLSADGFAVAGYSTVLKCYAGAGFNFSFQFYHTKKLKVKK